MRPRMALGNVVANETMFPYFSKGSSWLISKSSNIFLYKSSFCAFNFWRFGVLFCSLYPQSSLITQHWCLTSSPGLLPLMTVICSEREEFITFEIWIFIFQKCIGVATGGLYSPPGAVWGTFYYGCAYFISCLPNWIQQTHLVPWKGLKGPGQFFI